MSDYSFTDQELNDASALVDYLTKKYPKTSDTSQPYIGVSNNPIDDSEVELLESGGSVIERLLNAWEEYDGNKDRWIPSPSEPKQMKEAIVLYASVLTDLIEQFRGRNFSQRKIGDLTVSEFRELMNEIMQANPSRGMYLA